MGKLRIDPIKVGLIITTVFDLIDGGVEIAKEEKDLHDDLKPNTPDSSYVSDTAYEKDLLNALKEFDSFELDEGDLSDQQERKHERERIDAELADKEDQLDAELGEPKVEVADGESAMRPENKQGSPNPDAPDNDSKDAPADREAVKDEAPSKRNIPDQVGTRREHTYYMNSPKTIGLMQEHFGKKDLKKSEGTENAKGKLTEYMSKHNYGVEDYGTYSKDPEWQQLNRDAYPQSESAYFNSAVKSGNNPKVVLIGKGETFYMTSSSPEQRASGNFLTKEHPGDTSEERRENLQLPPENKAEVVERVVSERGQIGIGGKVAAQPEWAKDGGYEAHEGISQVYIPNDNLKGAIADGRYRVLEELPKNSTEELNPPKDSREMPPNDPPSRGAAEGKEAVHEPKIGKTPEAPDGKPDGNAEDVSMEKAGARSEYEVVPAKDIQGVESSGDHFWNHHANTKEDYMKLAEKLPEVQDKLKLGVGLEDIKKDPDLRDCAMAYYDPDRMVKVEKNEGKYDFQDDGRHRVAAARELGYDIPVKVINPEVVEASKDDEKVKENHDSTNDLADKADALKKLTEYMSEHNYGIGDYDEYSKDPEWEKLHKDAFPEAHSDVERNESEDLKENHDSTNDPAGKADALKKLTEYMSEHNYGIGDYDEYSKDPEWEKLHKDAFPEAHSDAERNESENLKEDHDSTNDPADKADALKKLTEYMSEHNYGIGDYDEYSKDPEWEKLHKDAFPEAHSDIERNEPDPNDGESPKAEPVDEESTEAEPVEDESAEAEPVEEESAEAEPVDEESTEEEPVEGEPTEAESVEEESAEAEPVEEEPVEAEPVEEEPVEGEPTEAEPIEEESAEEEPVEGEPAEAEPIEEESAEEEPVEGEPSEAEPIEEESAEEEPVEGEPTEAEPIEEESAEEEPVEGESTEAESVEEESAEAEPVEEEPVEEEPVEEEPVEEEPVEEEPAEAESAEEESAEEEPVEEEPTEAEPIEGESAEEEPVEEEPTEAEPIEGESAEEEPVEGEPTEAEPIEEESAEEEPVEGESTEAESVEEESAEAEPVEEEPVEEEPTEAESAEEESAEEEPVEGEPTEAEPIEEEFDEDEPVDENLDNDFNYEDMNDKSDEEDIEAEDIQDFQDIDDEEEVGDNGDLEDGDDFENINDEDTENEEEGDEEIEGFENTDEEHLEYEDKDDEDIDGFEDIDDADGGSDGEALGENEDFCGESVESGNIGSGDFSNDIAGGDFGGEIS